MLAKRKHLEGQIADPVYTKSKLVSFNVILLTFLKGTNGSTKDIKCSWKGKGKGKIKVKFLVVFTQSPNQFSHLILLVFFLKEKTFLRGL